MSYLNNTPICQLMIDQMPALFWSTDLELRFTSMMGAGLSGLNIQADQARGMTVYDFAQTQDRSHPLIEAHLKALQGIPFSCEAQIGKYVIQANIKPLLLDPSETVYEKIIGTIGIALDISEQKTGGISSRIREANVCQLFENSPNAIFSVNNDGIICSWNQACKNYFKIDQEVLGQKYHILLANASDEVKIDSMISQVFRDKCSFSDVDIAFHGQNGRVRYMLSRIYPILGRFAEVEEVVFANTDITERKLAEHALRRQLQELTVLHAVAVACAEANEEEALIERVTQTIGDALYPNNFGLILVNEATGMLEKHPSYRELVDDKNVPYPVGKGVTGRVALEGRPWRLADVSRESSYMEVDPNTRAELCVPLKVGERVIGVINAESTKLDAFSEDDERLLTIFAGQIATAIERIRAEKGEKQHIQELLAITRVSREVTAVLDRQQVLDSIVRLAAEISNSGACGLFTFRPDKRLHLVAAYGVGDEFIRKINHQGLGIEGTTVGRAITTRRPYQIPDIQQEPTYAKPQIAEMEGICSTLALPMLRGEEVIGGIVLWHQQPRHFTPEEEMFLQALANQSVNAVENARLFEAEREQRKLAEALRETGTILSASLDFNSVVDSLLEQVARIVPYDAANLMFIEENQARVTRTRGYERFGAEFAQLVQNMSFDIQTVSNLRCLCENKQSLIIGDTRAYPDWILLVDEWLLRSWVGAPVIIQGEVAAIFSLEKAEPDFYQPNHAERLAAFAGQASLALQNARLFEETRRRALQQETLSEIIAAAVATPDLHYLLETVLDLTLRAVGVDKGGLWVSGHSALRDIPQDVDAAITQVGKLSADKLNTALTINDSRELLYGESQAAWADSLTRHGVKAILFVPVLASGRQTGVLSLASSTLHTWLPEEIALAEAIGRQVGSAVERLGLLAKTQEQARQVQQIMDTVPDGVLLVDSSGRIVLANPAAQEYLTLLLEKTELGEPLSILGGQPFASLLSIDSERSWQEMQSQTASGNVFEVTSRPLEPGEKDGGWVIVIRDVTQEREDQRRIQMQERLATVGQLAAGIAHDFNNIMAAIVVYTDLLFMEPNLSPASCERLNIIQQQVQRATSLIRQILDFSRRAVMEQSALDLLPFLKELEKLLVRVLPENIHITLKYQSKRFMVRADPTRLQQALMNLIVNARDAMPFGGNLTIELDKFTRIPEERTSVPELSQGEWIRLGISDSGTGIPPDVIAHIFDPFFSTKPVGQGTGLGLAQVYGIVKQHGGHIDVRSKVDQGTTFEIYLPGLEVKDKENHEFLPSHGITGNGETVLIVEDDPATRDALQSVLETMTYHVMTSKNGEEALKLYNRNAQPFAAVVSDVVMPEMGGVALYHELRLKQPNIKFLFITGHPLDNQSQTLLEQGEVYWLQKPFSVQEFTSVLRSMLDEKV